ncbi:hypothetical protein B0H17DRAFT_935257, partial [Mycena rosella]
FFPSETDLLMAVKPQLDNPDPGVQPPLIKKLRQVALLAESFTEQRQKSNKGWLRLVDEVDQEGLSHACGNYQEGNHSVAAFMA